jgi:hypothetical protein
MNNPKMSGAEHWLRAEALLALAEDPGTSSYAVGALAAKAAVHAALAQAAPIYGWHRPVEVQDVARWKDGAQLFEASSCACTEHVPCIFHASGGLHGPSDVPSRGVVVSILGDH